MIQVSVIVILRAGRFRPGPPARHGHGTAKPCLDSRGGPATESCRAWAARLLSRAVLGRTVVARVRPAGGPIQAGCPFCLQPFSPSSVFSHHSDFSRCCCLPLLPDCFSFRLLRWAAKRRIVEFILRRRRRLDLCDVEDAGAARRAKAADQRRRRPPQEMRHPLRDCLLQEQSPLLAFRRICEIEPGFYRDCETLMRNLQGRVEVLAYSVHAEGDAQVEDYDEYEEFPPQIPESDGSVIKLGEKLKKQSISSGKEAATDGGVKQNRCNTCNAAVGDAKEYREHFKSDWHKHNVKRKARNLPPLTAEECLADLDLDDSKSDLNEYSF